MIKKILITVLLLTCITPVMAAESHGFVSASIEYKLDGYWIGEYPVTFKAGYRFKVNDNIYVAPIITHKSNLERGWPFSEKYEIETWSNTIGIEVEMRF